MVFDDSRFVWIFFTIKKSLAQFFHIEHILEHGTPTDKYINVQRLVSGQMQ